MIYLTHSKLNVVVLGNLAFLLLLSAGKLIKRVFLGSLSREELEELVQNSKFAITETCLALTIFREEIDANLLALFSALLFAKIFHWLLNLRVENLSRSHAVPALTHARLIALMALLATVDVGAVIWIGNTLWVNKPPNVLLLFGFEYLILSVVLWSIFCKYAIFIVDTRLEGRWNNKSNWVFYLEFTADLSRLFLYVVFFILICNYYGLPLHLIRELFVTFYTLRERVVKFIHYRRITANMNERFPDSTHDELVAADDVCIICRESMVAGTAKKLPQCGHHFHTHCLRSWLERSHSCPTCRAEIQITGPVQTENEEAAPADQPQQQAAAAIGPAAARAAAAQLPPLPPHLQAIIDARALLRDAAAGANNEVEEKKSSSSAAPSSSSVSSPSSIPPAVFSPPLTLPRTASPLLEYPPPAFVTSLLASRGEEKGDKSGALLSPSLFPGLGAAYPLALHGLNALPAIPASLLSTSIIDPLHLSLFHHHTLLLQHQVEFLTSQLEQAKLMFERQLEFQEKINQIKKQQEKQQGEKKEDGVKIETTEENVKDEVNSSGVIVEDGDSSASSSCPASPSSSVHQDTAIEADA